VHVRISKGLPGKVNGRFGIPWVAKGLEMSTCSKVKKILVDDKRAFMDPSSGAKVVGFGRDRP
jgi:hypothetical protein